MPGSIPKGDGIHRVQVTQSHAIALMQRFDHCILCDQQLLSTSIAHLVVECEQVNGHRIQSGLVPAIQKSRLRLLGRALDPSVENVYTWLRGGVLNGEADLDQQWLDGTVEHESMGTRHDNRALAARLADFLQQLLSTSIAHLVVECEQVTGHRIQSGLVPAIQKSRLRLLGRALDPGVENVYTWLRGGVLNGEADLDQQWLDGTVEHESMGTRHDNRALAARLADFLQQLLSTSIAHLVVECEQVTGHRIQSGLVPAIQKSRLRLLGRALDPGVENVYTWLRGGVLNGEADLDQRGWTGLWSMNLWGRGMIIGRWQHG
ncbi:hypothetical protein BASA62_005771 [Batrachochytrium salamandrivorans]|nr:hypothetical protein BASA62_005771 [Batrachochytrium salamandrivorans]